MLIKSTRMTPRKLCKTERSHQTVGSILITITIAWFVVINVILWWLNLAEVGYVLACRIVEGRYSCNSPFVAVCCITQTVTLIIIINRNHLQLKSAISRQWLTKIRSERVDRFWWNSLIPDGWRIGTSHQWLTNKHLNCNTGCLTSTCVQHVYEYADS